MVHNLDPLCPEEARQTDWAPWPPACKVIRQANNPQAIHKMLDSPTQKRSVFLLPEGASFPEIITWRTSVFPTSGGSLVLRPTGASGKGRHNVTKVRGLVLTPRAKSGAVGLSCTNKTTTPSSHFCQTQANTTSSFICAEPQTGSLLP